MNMMMRNSNTMNTREAANYLGYSRSYIYSLMNKGQLPYAKYRGRVILRREQLEAWRQGNTIEHPGNIPTAT